jgi:large subunit ribosomal protein L18Ae
MDMAARHRARWGSIQVIDVKEVPASETRRSHTKQFHTNKIRFPLPHRLLRPSLPKYKRTFRAQRPHTHF